LRSSEGRENENFFILLSEILQQASYPSFVAAGAVKPKDFIWKPSSEAPRAPVRFTFS
jgi:hypothetical protein